MVYGGKVLLASLALLSLPVFAGGSVARYDGLTYPERNQCESAARKVAARLNDCALGPLKILEVNCVDSRPQIIYVAGEERGRIATGILTSQSAHTAMKLRHNVEDFTALHDSIEKTFAHIGLTVLEIGDSEVIGAELKVVTIDKDRRGLNTLTYSGRTLPLAQCPEKLKDLREKLESQFGPVAGACLRSAGNSDYAEPVLFFIK